MNRRSLIQSVLASAVAGGVPGLLRARAPDSWLLGWKTLGREALGPTTATL